VNDYSIFGVERILRAENWESRAKVVVIEDNRDLLDDVVLYLRRKGFDAVGMADSLSLDRWYAEAGIDILVLDVNLPGEDGFSIARRLSGNPLLGIILLTGRSDILDKVKGLEGGADAYLCKPIDLQELVAAISALLRRMKCATPTERNWTLDPARHWLTTPGGRKIALSGQETILMSTLALRPGGADRAEIIRALGENPDIYDPRRLEALVSRLRRKLKSLGEGEEFLRAHRSSGYLFAAPLVRAE